MSTKAPAVPSASETIECRLCSGAGELSRAEILDRLGVRDFARVAQLSAEEAFRLLQQKHSNDHQSGWSRFEAELGALNPLWITDFSSLILISDSRQLLSKLEAPPPNYKTNSGNFISAMVILEWDNHSRGESRP